MHLFQEIVSMTLQIDVNMSFIFPHSYHFVFKYLAEITYDE